MTIINVIVILMIMIKANFCCSLTMFEVLCYAFVYYLNSSSWKSSLIRQHHFVDEEIEAQT